MGVHLLDINHIGSKTMTKLQQAAKDWIVANMMDGEDRAGFDCDKYNFNGETLMEFVMEMIADIEESNLDDQIKKLSPLVEIVSNQKQRIQQLDEQLAASKARECEYRKVITKALNINNLWMYFGDVPDGCEGKAEALGLMNNFFLDVLAKHKDVE